MFVANSFHMVFIAMTLLCCFFGLVVNGAGIFNALKVTWGKNISDRNYFNKLPRDEPIAVFLNWTKINDCMDKPAWRGIRYALLPDYSIVLLFDVVGQIAGIQMGIPQGLPNGFPGTDMQKYFVQDGSHYFSTVYFTDPEYICSAGRTIQEFVDQGTVSKIVLQTGENIGYNMELPLYPSTAEVIGFVQTGCVKTMGMHYWYDLSYNTDCNDYVPLFLLANNNRINGFGWVIPTLANSSRFEYPPSSSFSVMMSPVPHCLYNVGQITSLHVFLTDDISANKC